MSITVFSNEWMGIGIISENLEFDSQTKRINEKSAEHQGLVQTLRKHSLRLEHYNRNYPVYRYTGSTRSSLLQAANGNPGSLMSFSWVNNLWWCSKTQSESQTLTENQYFFVKSIKSQPDRQNVQKEKCDKDKSVVEELIWGLTVAL